MATAPKAAHCLPTNERLLLTYAEAGAYLNVSETTIRRLVAEGELPAADIGRMRRISRKALEAFANG